MVNQNIKTHIFTKYGFRFHTSGGVSSSLEDPKRILQTKQLRFRSSERVSLIDIHTHLLPIQDGPRNMEQAIRAIRIASENNISKIILTPHYFSGDTSYNPEQVKKTTKEFKKAVHQRGLKIQVYLGNECVVDDRIIEDIQRGKAMTMGGSKYILCEYPFFQVPFNYRNILYKLIEKGYKPIIAHPERNNCFASFMESLLDMKKDGCIIQVNAGSVMGIHGRLCKKHTLELIKNRNADIVASDAHSDTGCAPDLLYQAYKRIKKRVNEEYLKKLFLENPGNMIR